MKLHESWERHLLSSSFGRWVLRSLSPFLPLFLFLFCLSSLLFPLSSFVLFYTIVSLYSPVISQGRPVFHHSPVSVFRHHKSLNLFPLIHHLSLSLSLKRLKLLVLSFDSRSLSLLSIFLLFLSFSLSLSSFFSFSLSSFYLSFLSFSLSLFGVRVSFISFSPLTMFTW